MNTYQDYLREALANPDSFESQQLQETIEAEMYLLRLKRAQERATSQSLPRPHIYQDELKE